MNITTVGLDLAKSVSHLVCCNQAGQGKIILE
jgi:transposase